MVNRRICIYKLQAFCAAPGPPGNAVPYTGRMDQTKVEV